MAKRTTSQKSKTGLQVQVNFTHLLEAIEKAEGDIEAATWEAARKGARVMSEHLADEAKKSGIPSNLISEISYNAERDESGNRFACNVGWRMPENIDYNNLSAGQKVALLNYGTSSRHTKTGARRGWLTAKNFIRRAKKKARKPIKEAQNEALQKILGELKK